MTLQAEQAQRAASGGIDRTRRRRGRRRLRKVDLLIVACWTSVAMAAALFLAAGGISEVTSVASAITASGVVAGLVGTDLILVMLILAARVPLIDRTVGQDVAMAFHRGLGKPVLYLLLAHGALLTAGYAMSDSTNVVAETISLLQGPDLVLAYASMAVLIVVVVTSLVAVRRRFAYEVWHLIHLLTYVAVLIALPHQLSAGGVLADNNWQKTYWLALYVIAFGTIVLFRFIVPIVKSARHDIRVAEIERVAPGVVSLHLTGRHLDRLQAAGGQYAVWRFWSGATWWHSHPISFSAVPDATRARLTIRDLGAGSRALAQLRPGTRVSIEGPYGVFTDEHRTSPLLAIVAAGIGITPVRSLLEHLKLQPGEATILLRGTDDSQRYLWDEIGALTEVNGSVVYTMIGNRPRGMDTWMSAEAVERGVTLQSAFPRLGDSDLYVCGPRAWTELVLRDARAAGLPDSRIHTERFNW